MTEAANGAGAGMAIVFGNILDTIPGCLMIGAKFTAFGNLSLTLMLGMFLGGIPEAAASASMLTKAGYRPAAIFGLWSTDCSPGCSRPRLARHSSVARMHLRPSLLRL